jgi:hypothetical protein
MPILPLVLLILALLSPSEAHTACTCRCVENIERAVCDNTRDQVPVCGNSACPVAPSGPKPAASKRAPPAGTSHCEPMREYSYIFKRYDWTELCPSTSRNNIALIRPGFAPLMPTPFGTSSGQVSRRGSAPLSGPPCDTDNDCAPGNLCTRRNSNDPWVCRPR